jgi:hypothetical protein
MKDLLIGIAVAWFSFSDEGKAIRQRLIEEMKKKYVAKKENNE